MASKIIGGSTYHSVLGINLETNAKKIIDNITKNTKLIKTWKDLLH